VLSEDCKWWLPTSTPRAELTARGVQVSEVQEFPWGSFVFFDDPDGNGWGVQQLAPRN
jgi:hypothetical protein